MELFDLTEKVAIVTGGNRGIGFAIAEGLAKAGASVVIANRNAEAGNKAADSIISDGFKATSVPVDVSLKSSVENLVTKVLEDFSRIDILVNSAGVIDRGPVENFTEAQFDYIMDINLKGLFFCCQLVGKEMIKQNKGKIINISSNVSEVIQAGRVVYAASKAGVSHLTRGFALEWARYNIQVNTIAPGHIATDVSKAAMENEKIRNKILSGIPARRPGNPEEVANLVVYLCSQEAHYITGHIYYIDGGQFIAW